MLTMAVTKETMENAVKHMIWNEQEWKNLKIINDWLLQMGYFRDISRS